MLVSPVGDGGPKDVRSVEYLPHGETRRGRQAKCPVTHIDLAQRIAEGRERAPLADGKQPLELELDVDMYP
jgi:hypothetical protein